MTRQEIKEQIAANLKKIEEIELANINLKIEEYKLCDKEYWYTEGVEQRVISRKPKKLYDVVIGRVHWNEFFQDEDSPQGVGVTIERSKVVREDGVWQL